MDMTRYPDLLLRGTGPFIIFSGEVKRKTGLKGRFSEIKFFFQMFVPGPAHRDLFTSL